MMKKNIKGGIFMTSWDYRRIARDNLADNWKISILTALVACLVGGLITGAAFSPSIKIDLSQVENIPGWITAALAFLALITSGIALLSFIIGGTVQLGYARFLLDQHDHREHSLSQLFSQFDRFTAGFVQAFLRGLYIFLWTLLLIIPGIVAGYKYSMVPFLMAEHPNLTPSQAIDSSKALMDGHKWELFCLDLSFIGWGILAALTLNVGHIFLNPYKNAAHAAFYRKITSQR